MTNTLLTKKYMKSTLLILSLAFVATSVNAAEPILPKFDPTNFDSVATITNPYFPLALGYMREYSGTLINEDGEPFVERIVLTVVGAGPVLEGVPTIMVRDDAYQDGLHVEEALDYYAQDRNGDLWNMGEDVTNFNYDDSGKLIDTDDHGSWRVGVKNALPGYMMPANPLVGFAYEQEHSPADEALDVGEIMALDGTITGPTGTYSEVLSVFETSSIDPGLGEVKYYAKGVGLVRIEEGLDENRANPEGFLELTKLSN